MNQSHFRETSPQTTEYICKKQVKLIHIVCGKLLLGYIEKKSHYENGWVGLLSSIGTLSPVAGGRSPTCNWCQGGG